MKIINEPVIVDEPVGEIVINEPVVEDEEPSGFNIGGNLITGRVSWSFDWLENFLVEKWKIKNKS